MGEEPEGSEGQGQGGAAANPPGRAGAADPGLCGSCRHAQVVEGARSTFLRCGRHDEEPERFRRYPRLPVMECGGYEEAGDGDGRGDGEEGADGGTEPSL